MVTNVTFLSSITTDCIIFRVTTTYRGRSRLWKGGGHSHICHYCWCGATWDMHCHSVQITWACKACQHYQEILKITLLRWNLTVFLVIYHSLMLCFTVLVLLFKWQICYSYLFVLWCKENDVSGASISCM